ADLVIHDGLGKTLSAVQRAVMP
ncbi:NAD-dependent deacetylase, partial [Cutibacterium acnes subsp. acnes]|nr:NAD-dependent deacetylase [Cutibacterium acnes subsp. acnes]